MHTHLTPATSAAAPGSTQDAWTRPDTNHTAPVDAGSRAAAETAGVRHSTDITGGPVSDAGVAGMAGPAGAGRPVMTREARERGMGTAERGNATRRRREVA